jgi:hypothetical protein
MFSTVGYLAEGKRWEAKQDYYHRITSLAVQEAPFNTHLCVADEYIGDHGTKECSSAT